MVDSYCASGVWCVQSSVQMMYKQYTDSIQTMYEQYADNVQIG